MKLYEKFAERGYHTTIMTTYAIDFAAFEGIALSRLRSSGSRNNILLVDETMLQRTLSSNLPMPSLAGRYYSVTGVSSKGAFHPKIILQIGRDKGRLLIGSANMTASGLAGNLELEAVIECNTNPSSAQRIINACWEYLQKIIANTSDKALVKQLDWMSNRSSWLADLSKAPSSLDLEGDDSAVFVSTQRESSIFNQLSTLIDDDSVNEITILSPYWDNDLSSVSRLIKMYEPHETRLLIDVERAMFPNTKFTGLGNVKIFDIGPFSSKRFTHAKLLVLTSSSKDHVLFGSANCTVAALGTEGFRGNNEEACIYRTYEADYMLKELDLVDILKKPPTNPADLPLYVQEQEPGESSSFFNPGKFESNFGQLEWLAPQHLANEQLILRLFDDREDQLEFEATVSTDSKYLSVTIDTSELQSTPKFARLYKSDGNVSAPAIVTVLETIQNELKEVRSGKVQRAYDQLSGATEEGLWVLEIWEQLEQSEEGDALQRSVKPKNISEEAEVKNYQILDYQSFIAGARLRQSKSGTGRNSLTGSELSSIRAFLNRLLLIDRNGSEEDVSKGKAEDDGIFDLGDEVANSEEAIETGLADTNLSNQANPSGARSGPSLYKRRKSQEDIWNKVTSYINKCDEEGNQRSLSTRDLLLFRSLLMIVSVAGYAASESSIRSQGQPSSLSPLQVLPTTGSEHNWPRLLSMLLRSMFGGRKPRINRLQVDSSSDLVPDDIVESWATCFWCAQACSIATKENPIMGLDKLRGQIYSLTGLTSEQLRDSQIELILNRFNERFSDRLSVNPKRLMEAHSRSILQLSETTY